MRAGEVDVLRARGAHAIHAGTGADVISDAVCDTAGDAAGSTGRAIVFFCGRGWFVGRPTAWAGRAGSLGFCTTASELLHHPCFGGCVSERSRCAVLKDLFGDTLTWRVGGALLVSGSEVDGGYAGRDGTAMAIISCIRPGG